MTKFEVGKTYQMRSIYNNDCIFSFTIFSRTKKTISIDRCGNIVKSKVRVQGNEETCKPLGPFQWLSASNLRDK